MAGPSRRRSSEPIVSAAGLRGEQWLAWAKRLGEVGVRGGTSLTIGPNALQDGEVVALVEPLSVTEILFVMPACDEEEAHVVTFEDARVGLVIGEPTPLPDILADQVDHPVHQ